MNPVENIAVTRDFMEPNSIRYLSSRMYIPTTIGMFDNPNLIKGMGSGKRFSMIPSNIDKDANIETVLDLS